MYGWLPWVKAERRREADRVAAAEVARQQIRALQEEVEACPYRICERADGLWRVEYAYVWWGWRCTSSIQWRTARHASRLPSQEHAAAAVKRLLSPVAIRFDVYGRPVPEGGE